MLIHLLCHFIVSIVVFSLKPFPLLNNHFKEILTFELYVFLTDKTRFNSFAHSKWGPSVICFEERWINE